MGNTGVFCCVPKDTETLSPVMIKPTSDTTYGGAVDVAYLLPEAAKNESVTIIFTRMGGALDTGSPHSITFREASLGFHQTRISSSALGTAWAHANSTATVVSASGTKLLNGAIYSVRIQYKDAFGNSANSVAHSKIKISTVPPAPATSKRPSLKGSTARRLASVPL